MLETIKKRCVSVMKKVPMPNRIAVQLGAGTIISLLLLSWLRIRPLGILFLGLLGFWLYQTRSNLRIMAAPEMQQNFKNMVERVREYRRNQPSSFCGVASVCLLALAILGHLVSGSTVVLVGLITAAIVSTKYNIIIVKHEPKEYEWSGRLQPEVDLDEEFMPEANDNNLCVLQRASDLATISSPTELDGDDEEKSDEVPSEFLIEEVPEVNENTSDEDHDVEDLLPLVRGAHPLETVPESSYQITNLDISNEDTILFKKRHFKDDNSSLIDTSSSSDESLSKGLIFPDHTEVDGPRSSQSNPVRRHPPNLEASDIISTAVKAQTQALLANSGKILPSLVSSLVQWGTGAATSNPNDANKGSSKAPSNRRGVATSLDSSDDSDFEILDNEASTATDH